MAFDVKAFVAMQSAGRGGIAPSKRQVKVQSGRTGRKQHQAAIVLARAGGTTDLMKAIHAPADHALCHVVKSTTGMVNGVPFRNPQVTQGRYFMGR